MKILIRNIIEKACKFNRFQLIFQENPLEYLDVRITKLLYSKLDNCYTGKISSLNNNMELSILLRQLSIIENNIIVNNCKEYESIIINYLKLYQPDIFGN